MVTLVLTRAKRKRGRACRTAFRELPEHVAVPDLTRMRAKTTKHLRTSPKRTLGHASPPDLLPELWSSRSGGNRSCERLPRDGNEVERIDFRTTEMKSSERLNQDERATESRSFESTEPGRANRSNRDCADAKFSVYTQSLVTRLKPYEISM